MHQELMEPSRQEYPYSTSINSVQFNRPINWRKYLFLFLTNWYWFLIAIFISVSAAYLRNRYTLPMFQASATILIEEQEDAADLISEIRSVNRRRKKIELANEIAKLKTFSLHRRTIDSLGWDIFWTAHGRVAMERPVFKYPPYFIEIDSISERWYRNQTFFVESNTGSTLKFYNGNGIDTVVNLNTWNDIAGWRFKIKKSENQASYAAYSFTIYDPDLLAIQYLNKVNYEANEELGSIIKVSSLGPVFIQEIEYVNMLCANFINTGLERERLIAENTLTFVNEQIGIIQDSLYNTERQLLAFRIDKSVVDLSKEGQQAYDMLQKFYENKTQLKLKLNYYEYLKDYVQEKHDPQAVVAPILLDANDRMLITQVETLQKLYEERESLSFSVETENPSLIIANLRIQNTRKKILEIIDGLIKNNELSRKQIDIEESQIKKQLLQLPVSEQELLNIQRKYEVNNQFYTFLLEKRAEAGIKRASTVSNVRILDEANPYTTITTGKKGSFMYLTALIIGLLIPTGIIFMADYFDNRIKDRDDIEDNTNLPILGVVSHDLTGAKIPIQMWPSSAFAESFRLIRTNLQYILRDPEQKVIMISSTISGEGKTFIALNLSTILAMNNKKVLICGFDLRRPSLHKVFNLENDVGLSTFLAGKSNYDEIICKTNIEGLDAMIAGPIPPNPAELLETENLANLFDKASKQYDYIIPDTPPTALVTDALLISKFSHANLFVIRQNYSPKGILEIINNLKEKSIQSISLLVNDIKESKAFGYRYYYGYYYGYQYKYNYGYYHDYTSKNGEKA